MEHKNGARTTVYIEVEEFQSTSQQPHPYCPSPMDASNRGPGTSFYSAALSTSSPPPASRYFPTSATTLYPTSPTYSPLSPQWVSTFPTTFGLGSLSFTTGSPPYTPESPKWEPTPPTHNPRSPNWAPPSYTPFPSSPVYTPSSPKWAPTSPAGPAASPIGPPLSPEWAPRGTSAANYFPTSPGPVPPSPPYIPRSPEPVSRGTPPRKLHPTSPGPVPPSLAYVPQSPEWVPRSKSPANYCPTSPGPVPPSPSYVPRSPEWAPTSPLPAKLCPTSPGLVPPSPPYVPRSPDYAPTSPPLGPFSPSSPYTTDPYDELERELDGWWGRGRFVYNRARSVVPEEEEQGQRCERETSTEPSPDLPDWAEEADVEREAEQDIRAQQPVTVVPEEEELPDYEYYEQLDREEKEDQERDAEQHVQVQEPAAAVVPEEDDGNQPFNLFAFTSGHPDPSTFPWIRSNPFLPTPSASTREFTSESEDLPDYEYYEALEQETAAEMVAEKGVQVQQPAAAVPEEDLPDYEYYEELEQETPAEALVQLETQHSVVDPYPDIAKLNCVPRNEPHSNTYSSPSPKIFTHCDAEAEQKDWRSYSPFRTASKLDSSFPRASQKPIGRVKVEKRIDRMMWNKLMQKKMAVMIEVCEKYAPADVLKGLKLDR